MCQCGGYAEETKQSGVPGNLRIFSPHANTTRCKKSARKLTARPRAHHNAILSEGSLAYVYSLVILRKYIIFFPLLKTLDLCKNQLFKSGIWAPCTAWLAVTASLQRWS